jgi:hypothetical protein
MAIATRMRVIPPTLAPVQRPQMCTYAPTQRAVLDTQPERQPRNIGVPYGTGNAYGARGNGNDGFDGMPTRNAVQPQQRQEPAAGIQPGYRIDDANGNHIRDRWDDGATHIRDIWNDRNGARAHETWDTDGTHVRDAWNELDAYVGGLCQTRS